MANEQELIDQYHSGEMTPEQMIDFEKQLESNPALRAESNFQSDIINGLKEVRKAELKSRLSAIDMSPGWVEFAMQSTLVKSFGGVAVATLIGAGVYFAGEKQEETQDSIGSSIEVNAPQPENLELSFDLIEESPKLDEEVKNNIASLTKPEVLSVIDESPNREIVEKSEPKTIAPDFNAPLANLLEEENNFESFDLDALPEVVSSEKKDIDVSTESIKNIDIKYKYYDGKLFLKGDFDRAPYEILEINSAAGRRIFIQYLNKYYQVKTTDKLEPLPEVTDTKLINELKILKESK